MNPRHSSRTAGLLAGALILAALILLPAADCAAQDTDTRPVRDYCLNELKLGNRVPTPSQVPKLLLEGIRNGDERCVRALLERGADPNEPDGVPLKLALFTQRWNLAEILLDHRADIEYRGTTGKTPLMFAVEWKSVPAVKLLITRGANINVKIRTTESEALEDEEPLFMRVFRRSSVTIVQLFIDAGADVNFATKFGHTVLMAAANDADIVEALLKAGAKIDARDVYGHTVGCYVVMKNQKQKLAALRNFDPNFEVVCP